MLERPDRRTSPFPHVAIFAHTTRSYASADTTHKSHIAARVHSRKHARTHPHSFTHTHAHTRLKTPTNKYPHKTPTHANPPTHPHTARTSKPWRWWKVDSPTLAMAACPTSNGMHGASENSKSRWLRPPFQWSYTAMRMTGSVKGILRIFFPHCAMCTFSKLYFFPIVLCIHLANSAHINCTPNETTMAQPCAFSDWNRCTTGPTIAVGSAWLGSCLLMQLLVGIHNAHTSCYTTTRKTPLSNTNGFQIRLQGTNWFFETQTCTLVSRLNSVCYVFLPCCTRHASQCTHS